ncbi:ty3-gypsy retrotransposon protein [Tanacetum coccineum]
MTEEEDDMGFTTGKKEKCADKSGDITILNKFTIGTGSSAFLYTYNFGEKLYGRCSYKSSLDAGMLKHDDVYGVYEVHHLFIETEVEEMRPKTAVKKKDKSYRFYVDYRALNAEHQFYVKKTKCVFGADTLEYLGHMISGHRVEMDPKKVIAGGQEATSFQELKQQLSTTPILSLPDFMQEFVVEADASDYVIRTVLLQHNRPISYFSRKLGPRMCATATYQKELFAIVEAVYKWRQYLVGRRFKIRTDHKSIKELMQQVIQTPIQQKYVQKRMGFDFVVEYKPGVANQIVDALSRMYKDGELVKSKFMAISQPIVGLLGNLKSKNETLEELQALHQQLDTGSRTDGFWREQGLLIFRNRYYVGTKSKLKALLLREFHDTLSACHGSMNKMLVGLPALFYWREMRKSVKDYIKQCTVYQ